MEDKTTPLPISEDLSRKIISIAAGEAHTIALTGDGCVYSWGRGMFGRIGTGRETDELVPARVEFKSPATRIVGIAAGAYHSLAVSDDGSVWCWGYNICILLSQSLDITFIYNYIFSRSLLYIMP
ncbi:hypothetical protein N665_1712s0006 [Sinapis alba]|nr:hypothetical protein N665_1712s0006 [Sinapis alba]